MHHSTTVLSQFNPANKSMHCGLYKVGIKQAVGKLEAQWTAYLSTDDIGVMPMPAPMSVTTS